MVAITVCPYTSATALQPQSQIARFCHGNGRHLHARSPRSGPPQPQWRTAENSAAYLLDSLRPGLDLLDVGCGPGTITVDLARRVAPGKVIGIDRSDEVLTQAAAYAAEQHVDVTFETGDVYALAYDDASFDVVHAHQVLQHLSDPVAALTEMRRVTRHRRRRCRARRRLFLLLVGAARPKARPLAGDLSRGRPAQQRRAGCRPLPQEVGAGRRLHRRTLLELDMDVRGSGVMRVVG